MAACKDILHRPIAKHSDSSSTDPVKHSPKRLGGGFCVKDVECRPARGEMRRLVAMDQQSKPQEGAAVPCRAWDEAAVLGLCKQASESNQPIAPQQEARRLQRGPLYRLGTPLHRTHASLKPKIHGHGAIDFSTHPNGTVLGVRILEVASSNRGEANFHAQLQRSYPHLISCIAAKDGAFGRAFQSPRRLPQAKLRPCSHAGHWFAKASGWRVVQGF